MLVLVLVLRQHPLACRASAHKGHGVLRLMRAPVRVTRVGLLLLLHGVPERGGAAGPLRLRLRRLVVGMQQLPAAARAAQVGLWLGLQQGPTGDVVAVVRQQLLGRVHGAGVHWGLLGVVRGGNDDLSEQSTCAASPAAMRSSSRRHNEL